ncbi:MAG: hypothetical protein ACD_12C00617G0001 [uncultured bacterium]|nr:MAG: hypothetical protein ACD_12C00617G0001 [uncultured bacterium]
MGLKLFKPKDTITLGKRGEKLAAEYLKNKGLRIIEFNFKNSFGKQLGELDIIAKEKDCFVFVEVKTRFALNTTVVVPEENINRNKLHKLTKIINFYIKKNNLWDFPYRIDAISILVDKNTDQYRIKHLENIFF